MKIQLTKKQYRELVLSVLVGNWVREAVAERRGERRQHLDELEAHVLSFAKAFGAEDLTEYFHGKLVSNLALDKVCEELIKEYDNDEFWHSLIIRLGQRDFTKDITTEDRGYMNEHRGAFPNRVLSYYKKYEREFEEHGIVNLVIKM